MRSRSAFRKATRIYQFITNNQISFYMLWKESFVKHQKFSKYYDHGCRLIRICRIQWWHFLFYLKYPFRANLVQKIKTVSLSWNLVPWLIRICRVQWWCSLFLFSTCNLRLESSGFFIISKLCFQNKLFYLGTSNSIFCSSLSNKNDYVGDKQMHDITISY